MDKEPSNKRRMENESESKEGVVEVDYDVDEYLIDLL
jgi:hypothetical protein